MKHTSLQLSKKLNDAGFKGESEYVYFKYVAFAGQIDDIYEVYRKGSKNSYYLETSIKSYDILNDLCVKYSKELFGGTVYKDKRTTGHYTEILHFLQAGYKEEAEEYIKANSILK